VKAVRSVGPLNDFVNDGTPDAELAVERFLLFHGFFWDAAGYRFKGNSGGHRAIPAERLLLLASRVPLAPGD
jgi:hypothetical protein